MGLEDFERELAAKAKPESTSRHTSRRSKEDRQDEPRSRDKDEERRHRRHDDDHRHHRHHHHSSSSKRHDRDGDREKRTERDSSRHRHKRHHHRDRDDDDEDRHHTKRRRSNSPRASTKPSALEAAAAEEEAEDGDEWVEKEAMTAPPEGANVDELLEAAGVGNLKRDNWMEAPSSLDFEYKQPKRNASPKSQFVRAKEQHIPVETQHERKIHQHEMDQLMQDLEDDDDDNDDDAVPEKDEAQVKDEPAQHEVSYTFGDNGAQWRMTKLKAVYRQAKETGTPVEDVALDRFGSLRDYDDAREEERELDRRKMYGKDYVGLEKPSGELYKERQLQAGIHRQSTSTAHGQNQRDPESPLAQGQPMSEAPAPAKTLPLDATALNKLKAQMMRAKLRKAPNAAELEAEYNAAAAGNKVQPDVVVLSAMENRMLTGGREGEVRHMTNKRGVERGLVEENEDMSIEDMVRQERRTRGLASANEGRALAERIAKDAKFDDNLDYMDENAQKLAKRVAKSDINLRNTAIGDFQKMQRVLDSCPLCHHEDKNEPPQAPILSLATRVYMTLPTEPEISSGSGAVIVPISHHLNLLECDDDEWEEIRNFMKALTRMYYARDRGVVFYENAAFMHSRRGHAALIAVPLPLHLAENAPAYFKEAVLSSDEEWSQHKKIIDTLALAQRPGFGKTAFRKALVKEMPYFHVWFNIDGGLGHVIEDERRWPKGDLFAREVLGGMLGKGPEVVKKQGRWTRQDARTEGFKKRWDKFDWTKILYDAPQ